jgi:hypothetical protein
MALKLDGTLGAKAHECPTSHPSGQNLLCDS